MNKILSQWSCLGILVNGEIDRYVLPENLILQSIENIESEGRLLGILTTWLSRYGHLLITKKLKFKDKRQQRLFSAIVEASKSSSEKLNRIILKNKEKEKVFLFDQQLTPSMKKWAKLNPHPIFLKHGFILKDQRLVREKILLHRIETFKRSKVLKNRALYGSSVRSDLLTFLPILGHISVRALAKKLNTSHPTLLPIIKDLMASGIAKKETNEKHAKIVFKSDIV